MLDIRENKGDFMTIEAIRDNIHQHVGNEVVVTYNEGRNKVSHCRGKVVEVYHNIFIVMDKEHKMSFSYYDVLTRTAKITFKRKKNVKF